ncbi:hypothetical protein V1478_013587 [Vespula squamosa]|uniref:Uncharacterized protein n=1 Tax=Vespula squamosa TaxID=30214 RepID=A0ABD2A6B8_VESSQ
MAVIGRPEERANAKQQVVFARELPWPPIKFNNEYRIDDQEKENKTKQKKEREQMSKEGSRTSYRCRLSIVGEATIWTPPTGFRVKLQRGGYQSNSNEQATLRPGRL